MAGYTVRSLLWTTAAGLGTTSELLIDVEGWPKRTGKALFPGPILTSRQGIDDPATGTRPWPDALWVETSCTMGSIRVQRMGTRANFAIQVNGQCVASAEFMAAVADHRGHVSCKFARAYDGALFRAQNIAFDLLAGWHGDGVPGPFFIERSDHASANFNVSIYEIASI